MTRRRKGARGGVAGSAPRAQLVAVAEPARGGNVLQRVVEREGVVAGHAVPAEGGGAGRRGEARGRDAPHHELRDRLHRVTAAAPKRQDREGVRRESLWGRRTKGHATGLG